MKNAAIIILLIIAILNGIYGFMQSIEANNQAALARKGEQRALLAEDDALRARDRADKDREEALAAQQAALQALEECKKNKRSK